MISLLPGSCSRQPGLPLRAKLLPAILGLLSPLSGAGSGSGPHGAQRLRPGRVPGQLFHAFLPDPAATPLAAEAPRDPRSAARRSIHSAGTQRPGPRRGRVLQAPEDQCLGKRPALFHPVPLTPPPRACSPEAVERHQAAPPHTPNMWPEPGPAPHSLAQAGVLITRGLQREETERLLCPWGCSRQEYCNGLPCPPSSRGSSLPRDQTQVSHIGSGFFTI